MFTVTDVVDDPALRGRTHVFTDRSHAGALLADALREYQEREHTYVLAIPAGGVPVAYAVAHTLRLPWDLAVTRKLHIPWNREAGFGAVSWSGVVLLNEPLVASLGLREEEIARCIDAENAVLGERLMKFRGARPFPNLTGRTVIVVDDGLASGYSMLATVQSLTQTGCEHVVAAVPTAPVSALALIRPHVARVVCLNVRSGPVFAVADAYQAWYDLTDTDVLNLLERTSGNP
jgi:predicted phosphoribosyltransferase